MSALPLQRGQRAQERLAFVSLAALLLAVMSAQADWPNTNATKFVQLPDVSPNGMDIFFNNNPTILADDFVCSTTGPISDIHLWISSLQNIPTTGGQFELSIWSDVPADPAGLTPSHPGDLLWSEVFGPGRYRVAIAANDLQEQFWNFDAAAPIMMGFDTRLFLYNFSPEKPFTQQGTAARPLVYWLGVSMLNNEPFQGWKTSTNGRGPDDAALGHYIAGAPTVKDWKELRDPRVANGPSLNFAFALTTTNPPPSSCPETNGVKFIQRPNLDTGWDVQASLGVVLADDFICTNSGLVSDIHIWGSWLQDAIDLNVPIWLGIYDDVPAGPNMEPSHPGNLLWDEWFGPGQYVEIPWAIGLEQFYNPSTTPPSIIGQDKQAYYLCFYPTNPFPQKGTLTAPTIYWLSVYASLPATDAPFGWKTSLRGFQDAAVWAKWSGGPPTAGWNKLVNFAGADINLAFKLTTASNCPPVTVFCPKDKIVECGSLWTFNPPTFATNECCGTNVTIYVVGTVTNGMCPWLITRTWEVVDCSSNKVFCTQTVTVVDTTPPTIVCGTNKTVPCDVPWSFDPPTASDRCCTNVSVVEVGTVTNGVCPLTPFITVTRTWMAIDCCSNTASCSQTVTVECCAPSTNKWVQHPDLSPLGMDVLASLAAGALPKILAEDFLCTNTGPITNIQVWGSWLDDRVDKNAKFMLAIWTDVTPATGGYSRPGQLLWSNWFGPDDYALSMVATGEETFYNPNLPGTSGLIGTDKQMWLYSFFPKQPFCQQGATNKPVIYWLSVTVRSPIGALFGWKTSTNHWKDDAVFGHLNAAGVPLGDWKDLHDPRPNMENLSLALAFLLNTGPATSDCDPQVRPKFLQRPDVSTNGLDVRATVPKILADDFRCRIRGQINGITVWGSWLGDVVDTNAQFLLGLWTDVPATPAGLFSHPGKLLCTSIFNPPQTVGTSLLRYNYRLVADNLRENFYDPDLVFPPFLGRDTQIWRYDFYPFVPSCWVQKGSPFRPITYWLSVSALTDTNKFLFGWKTSIDHYMDDGVFGHLNADLVPLRDWKELRDPRTGRSLDLAFALRSFPVIGINKDLRNTTSKPASCLEIVVAGVHDIIWHYDGTPPWPNFQVTYAGGNTVLRWCGLTLQPGQVSHIGFEMSGTSLTLVGMHWLDALGNVIGHVVQVGHHMLGNGGTLQIVNDVAGAPVLFQGGTVEVYSNEPPSLETMVVGGMREPMSTFPLPGDWPMAIPEGGTQKILIPAELIPPEAQFLLFVTGVDPFLPGGVKAAPATTDFVLLPLDTALAPVIEAVDNSGGVLSITWTSVPGRAYRVRSALDLSGAPWVDVGDIIAVEADTTMTVPVGPDQTFYRVVLLPE